MGELIFKIADLAAWSTMQETGLFSGSEKDLEDGFIHFSTADQVAETANKHFRDVDNLMLIAVDADQLGTDLRFEPSRNNELFPHLYRRLQFREVIWARAFPCPLCELIEQPRVCRHIDANSDE